MAPRLLIAGTGPVATGVRVALEGVVEVCAQVEAAEEAPAAAAREGPDVCIVNLELPGGGLTAVQQIHVVAPDTGVIVLADELNADDLLACVYAGAVGYLATSLGADALRRAVNAVAEGEAAIPRSLLSPLVRALQEPTPNTHGLTTRESQVIMMLQRGDSTSLIAQRLGISPVTVRRHISASMRKTGAANRAALLRRSSHSPQAPTTQPRARQSRK